MPCDLNGDILKPFAATRIQILQLINISIFEVLSAIGLRLKLPGLK